VGLALLQPYPRHQEGSSLCFPVVGPVIRISRALSDTAAARVRVHEQVHAEQCRTYGGLRLYALQLTAPGRLRLEAEAGCAEADYARTRGRRAGYAYADLIDNLTYGMPRGQAPTPEEARRIADRACPDLAAAARVGEPGPGDE